MALGLLVQDRDSSIGGKIDQYFVRRTVSRISTADFLWPSIPLKNEG